MTRHLLSAGALVKDWRPGGFPASAGSALQIDDGYDAADGHDPPGKRKDDGDFAIALAPALFFGRFHFAQLNSPRIC